MLRFVIDLNNKLIIADTNHILYLCASHISKLQANVDHILFIGAKTYLDRKIYNDWY